MDLCQSTESSSHCVSFYEPADIAICWSISGFWFDGDSAFLQSTEVKRCWALPYFHVMNIGPMLSCKRNLAHGYYSMRHMIVEQTTDNCSHILSKYDGQLMFGSSKSCEWPGGVNIGKAIISSFQNPSITLKFNWFIKYYIIWQTSIYNEIDFDVQVVFCQPFVPRMWYRPPTWCKPITIWCIELWLLIRHICKISSYIYTHVHSRVYSFV